MSKSACLKCKKSSFIKNETVELMCCANFKVYDECKYKDCIRSYQYMVFDILDKMEQESKNKRDK